MTKRSPLSPRGDPSGPRRDTGGARDGGGRRGVSGGRVVLGNDDLRASRHAPNDPELFPGRVLN